MKGLTQAAVACAIVLAAGFTPAAGTRAQSSDTWIQTFDAGRGSRIGVTIKDADDAKAGVTVESVSPDGPADKAGIKAGDVITDFDGEKVRSVIQFSRLVRETPSKRTVAVVLTRGGQRQTVNVTTETTDDGVTRLFDFARTPRPATPPAPPAAPRAPRPPLMLQTQPFDNFPSVIVRGRRLGASIETLDDQLAGYFGVKEGVLVKSVAEGSAGQKAGLKAGDVITSINGRQIYDTTDVNRAIDRNSDSDDFTMEITRDKKTQTLKGKFDADTRVRRGIRTLEPAN
jgi:S1-C subfamily serine protease